MINPQSLDLSTLPCLALEEKSNLPSQSAIYFAIDFQGNIQYIGRSVNLRQRWTAHHKFSELHEMGDIRIAYLFIDVDLLPDVESALIEWFKPILNKKLIQKQNGSSNGTTVSVALTLEEYEVLQNLARVKGVSKSDILRSPLVAELTRLKQMECVA
jgi:hypothetical protein